MLIVLFELLSFPKQRDFVSGVLSTSFGMQYSWGVYWNSSSTSWAWQPAG